MSLSTNAVFTTEALDLLNARLKEADSLNDFFSAVDALADEEKYLVNLPVFIEFSSIPNPHNDSDTALMLLDAIGEMDRANATDPRLWSFLALVVFREYLLQRWPRTTGTEWKTAISERWLLTKPSRRKLLRHGIARLWWVANLTYDPKCVRGLTSKTGDPHAYTRWTFENQNRVQSIFERQLGSNQKLMWVMIEMLYGERKHQNAYGSELANLNDSDAAKWITKEVHLRAGYRHLEILDDDEIKAEVIS